MPLLAAAGARDAAGPPPGTRSHSGSLSRSAEPYLRQGIAPDYSQAAARSLTARLAGHPRMLWRTVRHDDQLLAVNAAIVEILIASGADDVGNQRSDPSPT